MPGSALAFLFHCLSFNFLTIIISLKILNYFSTNYAVFALLYCLIAFVIYQMNKRLFLVDKKCKLIEEHYDRRNRLKKGHFAILSILYFVISLGLMILAEINYEI